MKKCIRTLLAYYVGYLQRTRPLRKTISATLDQALRRSAELFIGGHKKYVMLSTR